MNDVENVFVILGILTIFIGIPTFFICGCKCKKNQNNKYFEI
jgi:hypothetical protein